MEAGRARDTLVLAHSSDIHVDTPRYYDATQEVDNLEMLRLVVDAARAAHADVLLLAGDVFEHNRLPQLIVDHAFQILAQAEFPIVILPGNHDPLTADSVYRRAHLEDLANVYVIGLSVEESLVLPTLDLEIWGQPHWDYLDMAPLRRTLPRQARWQVAMAHGHFTSVPDYSERFRASWLISEQDVNHTVADYVALGHWDRNICVSSEPVPAYYSGSPHLTGAVNVVRLSRDAPAQVSRWALAPSELALPLGSH